MNIKKVELPQYEDRRGLLAVAEKFGFPAERAFWIYGARPGDSRGNHAHYHCSQLLVAVQGGVTLEVFDGWMLETNALSSPINAVIVPPLHWITLKNFSRSAIVLVLCSHEYDKSDVIADLQKFQDLARGQT